MHICIVYAVHCVIVDRLYLERLYLDIWMIGQCKFERKAIPFKEGKVCSEITVLFWPRHSSQFALKCKRADFLQASSAELYEISETWCFYGINEHKSVDWTKLYIKPNTIVIQSFNLGSTLLDSDTVYQISVYLFAINASLKPYWYDDLGLACCVCVCVFVMVTE